MNVWYHLLIFRLPLNLFLFFLLDETPVLVEGPGPPNAPPTGARRFAPNVKAPADAGGTAAGAAPPSALPPKPDPPKLKGAV